MTKPTMVLFVEAGPTTAEIQRNAKQGKHSEFIVVSKASGKSDRVYIVVPEISVNTREVLLRGMYKIDRLRYVMLYFPASGTGMMEIYRSSKEEEK